MAEVPKVLVTGASGYIATHCIKQLLEGGKYAVRGTVRSLQKEEKVRPLKELVPSPAIPLELVEADLLKEDSWPSAVEGCKYVLHLASPFVTGSVRDEMELIRPAVEGTRNVLRACADAGVKRVVLTSSIAAISNGTYGATGHGDEPYTEENWTQEAEADPYCKSKTLAERAAWDLLKELPEEKKFELAVINPSYVQGPLLSRASGEGSAAVLQMLFGGQLPGIPDLNFALVDVRDVAAAHIVAMEHPEAAGHRHIIVTGNMWMKEMAVILQQEFQGQGYRFKTGRLPKFVLQIAGLFSYTARTAAKGVGKVLTYDTDRMRSVLGINPIPLEQTLVEMGYSLIDYGLVERKPGYKGRVSSGGEKAKEPADKEGKDATEEEEKKDSKEETQPAVAEAETKPPVEPSGEEKKDEAVSETNEGEQNEAAKEAGEEQKDAPGEGEGQGE